MLEPKFADLRTFHVLGFIQVAVQIWVTLYMNYEKKKITWNETRGSFCNLDFFSGRQRSFKCRWLQTLCPCWGSRLFFLQWMVAMLCKLL